MLRTSGGASTFRRVLPKALRESARIEPGDKLALVTWEKEGEVCCLALLKADRIADLLQGVLGPLLGATEKEG
jgi:antitoxin PrlF